MPTLEEFLYGEKKEIPVIEPSEKKGTPLSDFIAGVKEEIKPAEPEYKPIPLQNFLGEGKATAILQAKTPEEKDIERRGKFEKYRAEGGPIAEILSGLGQLLKFGWEKIKGEKPDTLEEQKKAIESGFKPAKEIRGQTYEEKHPVLTGVPEFLLGKTPTQAVINLGLLALPGGEIAQAAREGSGIIGRTALRGAEAALPRTFKTGMATPDVATFPGLGIARKDVERLQTLEMKKATVPVVKEPVEKPYVQGDLSPEAKLRDIYIKKKLSDVSYVPVLGKPLFGEPTLIPETKARPIKGFIPTEQADINIGKQIFNNAKVTTLRYTNPKEFLDLSLNDKKVWFQEALVQATPADDMMGWLDPLGKEIKKRWIEGERIGSIWAANLKRQFSYSMKQLTPEETANFWLVMDKNVAPINNKVHRIANQWREVMRNIAKEVNESGVRTRTPEGLKEIPIKETYAPHRYDFEGNREEIIKSLMESNANISRLAAERITGPITGSREALLKNIMREENNSRRKILIAELMEKSGKKPTKEIVDKMMKEIEFTRGEAKKRLDQFAKEKSMVKRAGHIDYPRTTDMPGYITDPYTAFGRYFDEMTHRVSLARQLGVNNEIAEALIKKMPHARQDIARGLLEAMTENVGGGDIAHLAKRWADRISDFMTRRFMGTSVIGEVDQGVYGSTVRTSLFNALNAFKAALGPDAKLYAKQIGTMLDEYAQGFSKFVKTKDFLTKSWFHGSSQRNNVVTTWAARDWLPTYMKALRKNPLDPRARRELKYLGFDDSHIDKIVKRGQFTQDEAAKVAYTMTRQTQFRFSPATMPMLYSNSGFKIFYHLQSFVLNWTSKVFINYVIAEARQRNFMPLLKLMSYGVVSGEMKQSIWNTISDKERKYKWDEKPFSAAFEAAKYATSFGILGEALAPQPGKTYFEGAFAPPMVGFGMEAERGLRGLAEGEIEPAARFGLRRLAVPYAVIKGKFPAAVGTKIIGERLIKALGGDEKPKPAKKRPFIPRDASSSLQDIFKSIPESLKYTPLLAGVLVGGKAKGFGKLAGLTAEQLAKKSPEELKILAKTMPKGAFSGLWDKQVRAEISDVGMKIKVIPREGDFLPYRLDEVIKHDKLFKAYPEFKEIKVIRDRNLPPGEATFIKNYDDGPAIVFNIYDKKQFENTLIHEIQHAIQDTQETLFAKGTVPETEKLYVFSNKKELRNKLLQEDSDYRTSIRELERIKKGKSIFKKDEAIKMERYYEKVIKETEDDYIKMFNIKFGEKEYSRYMRTSGEIEANFVELRRKHPDWSIQETWKKASGGRPVRRWINRLD